MLANALVTNVVTVTPRGFRSSARSNEVKADFLVVIFQTKVCVSLSCEKWIFGARERIRLSRCVVRSVSCSSMSSQCLDFERKNELTKERGRSELTLDVVRHHMLCCQDLKSQVVGSTILFHIPCYDKSWS